MATVQKVNFNYTGGVQTFVAPYTGVYDLEVWGAQGGESTQYSGSDGGNGGYSKGTVSLEKGETLWVYVGQKGPGAIYSYINPTSESQKVGPAFNGGGIGRGIGAAGGGGTDIRKGGSALSNRILVAGGGGGMGSSGGSAIRNLIVGGGLQGSPPYSNSSTNGSAPTQLNPGINSADSRGNGYLGRGGDAPWVNSMDSGGGGGGYYGGAAATTTGSGSGGGGSGYIGGVSNGQTLSGNQSMPNPNGGTQVGQGGHGRASITLLLFDLNQIENISIDKDFVFSGDEIEITWDLIESDIDFLYDIEVNIGSGWTLVVNELSKDNTSYVYLVPVDRPKYDSATFRIRSKLIGNSYTDEWKMSPPFIINRYGFLVRVENQLYGYQNDDWIETGVTEDKELFSTYGMGDLDHIPESKWDEFAGDISLVTFTNSKEIPIVDVTSPGYKPIYFLNERSEVNNPTVTMWSSSKDKMTLKKKVVPHRQLVYPTKDIKLWASTIPEAVVRINLASSQSEGTLLKVMFSIDSGDTYKSWSGSEWLSFEDLIDDEDTKELLSVNGMTPESLNALTKEQLGEVFGYGPYHRTVRFIYLYDATEWTDVTKSIDLAIHMDMHGEWQQAKEEDFTYGYPTNDELHVQLFKSGSYKINGLLYGDTIVEEQEV